MTKGRVLISADHIYTSNDVEKNRALQAPFQPYRLVSVAFLPPLRNNAVP